MRQRDHISLENLDNTNLTNGGPTSVHQGYRGYMGVVPEQQE